nr:MAG TPA: major capsid protein [Caudoviricetes sp.]
MTTMTKLTNLVNPQVMADMISAELPAKIKVAPLAKIDNTLVGRAGNTITLPSFGYIGEAKDVAEGVAIDLTQMSTSTKTATVKKAGKGVEISDEAVLSGYGDPVGEARRQLTLSIADKIDSDCMDELKKATLSHDLSATAIISYEGIVDAIDKFEEEDYEDKVIFVHPKQVTQLRKDPNFLSLDKYPVPVIMNGVIGSIAGCQVVVSKKVDTTENMYKCPIVKAGALTIYMKRAAEVEADRDILKKTTVITADEHFVAKLTDESKVVLAKFKDVE